MHLQSLNDAFDELCKGDTDVPECVETWWHLIITHLSPPMGENFILVCIQDLLGMALLFDVSSKVSGNNFF